MIDLFYLGGSFFMGLLTLIASAVLLLAVLGGITVFSGGNTTSSKKLLPIKEVGLFAFITGILGTLIGLYGAFEAIEIAGEVSMGLLAAGLKIASITSIYGMLIYLVSLLFWFGLDIKLSSK